MIGTSDIPWKANKGYIGPWKVFHRGTLTERLVGAAFVDGVSTNTVQGRDLLRLAASLGKDLSFAILLDEKGEPKLDRAGVPMIVGDCPEVPVILRRHGFKLWARMFEDAKSGWEKPLEHMTIRELKAAASDVGVVGYSAMSKAELKESVEEALERIREEAEAAAKVASEPTPLISPAPADPQTPEDPEDSVPPLLPLPPAIFPEAEVIEDDRETPVPPEPEE